LKELVAIKASEPSYGVRSVNSGEITAYDLFGKKYGAFYRVTALLIER
jgi:hypothetical protein